MDIGIRKKAIVSLSLILGVVLAIPASAQLFTQIQNGSFDQTQSGFPTGWNFDQKAQKMGIVQVINEMSGGKGGVLKLSPNMSNNTNNVLLGVGQRLDASEYVGKTIFVGANMGATEGARAVIGIHALGKAGDLAHMQLSQAANKSTLSSHIDNLFIPKDADHLIIYAIVDGHKGSAYFDELTILSKNDEAPVSGNKIIAAKINVNVNSIVRIIPNTLFGSNIEWINNGQGIWSDKINEIEPDAIKLTRNLGVSLLRFPGGVFSDYYHWKDGIGPQKDRPIKLHYPNGPKSRHSFGTMEALQFARASGSRLFITVNAGTGSSKEAEDWVSFINKDMVGKDPENRVTYWEVGNELYIESDLSRANTTPEHYSEIYLKFADAMKAVDPSIKIGAIGGLNYGPYRFVNNNNWNEILLQKAHEEMDFLSVHNAYAPVLIGMSDDVNPLDVYRAMLAAPVNIQKNLEDLSEQLEKYDTPDHMIRLAVTEWGPFFHVSPENIWVDHIKTLGSALFVGSTMNAFYRVPRLEVATFFKLTDQGFMGWIGNRNGKLATTAPYLAFQLYQQNFGPKLLETTINGPTFNSPAIGVVDQMVNVPYLDVVASKGDSNIYLFVVNKHFTQSIKADIDFNGLKQYKEMTIKQLAGKGIDAHTGTELPEIPGLIWAKQKEIERFHNGAPDEVYITQHHSSRKTYTNSDVSIQYSFPAQSITCLILTQLLSDK